MEMLKIVLLTACALILVAVVESKYALNATYVVDGVGVVDAEDEDEGDEASGDDDIPPISSTEDAKIRADRTRKSGEAFNQILIECLSLTRKAFLGTHLGMFTAAVTYVMGLYKGPDKDIWSQIESKVVYAIQQHLTDKQINDFRARFDVYRGKMMRDERFDDGDLIDIVGDQHHFFPQNHKGLLFSSQFVTAIEAYLIYLTAGYLELITRDKVPNNNKCALAMQLSRIRNNLVEAAKDLHKKRYKEIEAFDFLARSVKDQPGRIPPKVCGFETLRHNQCNGFKHFQYKDKSTGLKYTEYLPNVERFVFQKIQKNTTDIFMDLVNKFNRLYLNEDICQEGCDIPEPITRGEIDFKYPTECYEKGNKGCVLPCGIYDWYKGNNWCATNLLVGQSWSDGWDYCTKADFNKCMITKKVVVTYPFLKGGQVKKKKS